MDLINNFRALSILLFVVGVYLAPLLVAIRRRHRNAKAISALNILLGWTVLGWVGSLVWSLTENVEGSADEKNN